jgi:hypothetical protein
MLPIRIGLLNISNGFYFSLTALQSAGLPMEFARITA